MEDLIRQRDEAEAEYLETGSAEAWADFLHLSIKIEENRKGNKHG